AQRVGEVLAPDPAGLPVDQEDAVEAEAAQRARLRQDLGVAEHLPADPVVRAEPAVSAHVGARVREVERRVEPHGPPEPLDREAVGGLRHLLQVRRRRRRQQGREVLEAYRPAGPPQRAPDVRGRLRGNDPRDLAEVVAAPGVDEVHGRASPRNAVRGEVALARAGSPAEPGLARPASQATRPASTPSRKACAIATGSAAAAIAVFTSTASAPSSSAAAAWDGAPRPASTTTGTRLWATMISRNTLDSRPRLLPIGEPRGITAAAPASSSLLHSTGSAWTYGRTTKPLLTSSSVAWSVSTASGIRYFGSGWISSLSQFVPSASRASSAASTASRALRAPEVFGSSRKRPGSM